jgi:hypothetical protein
MCRLAQNPSLWQLRRLRNADRNPPDGASTLASTRFLQKKVLEDELPIAGRELGTASSAI